MTRIRVKFGQAEAEVEADSEHIREAIELVPELAAKLPHQSGDVAEQKEPGPEAQADVSAQYSSEFPVVVLQKGDSLADVIGKFFSSPWGREKRKLSDVREALQSYGLNYPKQSVAVALLRLAKTTKLRRFKAEDGEYVYTSALNVPSVQVSGGTGMSGLVAAQTG
ncbi:MAG TPA: hypothetical protein VEJ19_09135 [Nitrososphaerales archaeon]|nr:hypothetical protein [Nitrososphaerales archaeon]